MRDAKTLVAASEMALQIVQRANKDLNYYRIIYACVTGGRNFKTQRTGK